MKKIIALVILAAMLMFMLLCSCNNTNNDDTNSNDSNAADTSSDSDKDSEVDSSGTPDTGNKDDNDSTSSGNSVIEHTLKVENSVDLSVFDSENNFGKEGNTNDYTTATEIDVSRDANGQPYVIKTSGIYRIYGKSTDGQILVNLKDEKGGDGHVVLVLDNLDLTYSGTKAVINAEKCEQVTIVIPENTTTTLTDSANNEEKGVIYVKSSNLVIDGKGTLNLNAKSEKSRGVFNTKTLTINGGIFNVTTDFSHGIQGEQGLIINGGTFTINSAKSGLKVGDLDEDEPEKTVVGALEINGGSLSINSTTNGISAYGSVTINSGYVNINATTDGVDITEGVTFNGGIAIINSLDDGIKSDTLVNIAQNANVKILSANDGIDAVTVNVSTQGVVYIETNVNDMAFIEDVNGSYIIKNGRYTLVDASKYPNETHYSLESCKGIKLDGVLTITSGTVGISSYEDAIDCASVTIQGGKTTLSSKYDGIEITGNAVINGSLEIIYSNKGIKASSVTVNENGKVTVISTSDAVNSNLVTVNGGLLLLLEKLDLKEQGKLVVNSGTVIALSSTNDPVSSIETDHKSVLIAGYSKTSNLVYGNWFRISNGESSIVFRLPKSYEDKLSITCISDAINPGTFSLDVGTYQVGDRINAFVYKDGAFTVIDTLSVNVN